MAKATSGSNQAQFGLPDRGKRAGSRASAGRLCHHQGCSTVLTTYNSGTTCWLHTDSTYKHPLARS